MAEQIDRCLPKCDHFYRTNDETFSSANQKYFSNATVWLKLILALKRNTSRSERAMKSWKIVQMTASVHGGVVLFTMSNVNYT